MSNKFKLLGEGTWDKGLTVEGPFELNITIDYDDVNHGKVDKEAKKLIKILNKHWNKTP